MGNPSRSRTHRYIPTGVSVISVQENQEPKGVELPHLLDCHRTEIEKIKYKYEVLHKCEVFSKDRNNIETI